MSLGKLVNVMNKYILSFSALISVNVLAITPDDFVYKNALSVECKEGSPMQEDLMYCVSRYYLTSDLALNTIYKTKINNLASSKKIVLTNSQRKWLNRRNKDCDEIYKEEIGGREAPINYLFCYAEQNEKRTLFLKNYN